jgi:hypothetical protein
MTYALVQGYSNQNISVTIVESYSDVHSIYRKELEKLFF